MKTRTPEEERIRNLKRRYSLSVADFNALFRAQVGRCELCKELMTIRTEVHIDHDHETGKVRGLVHSGCNARIADHTIESARKRLDELRDQTVMMNRVVAYLQKHQ